MSAIKVENLVKNWGTFVAVDNVSFETGDAEFVALLGPSGCGKSTTLRLIAGLEQTSSGRITIKGRDVTDAPSARRNLSMVFQSYALFPHLTVAENITFGLSVRHVPRAERQERLKETVEILGLGHLLDRKPSQLSGGQQQRVALGRALISRTPVCLLDEPLSNLDAKLRTEMRNEIRSLQRRLGITMIFVTHDQSEAMSMADRVILMREGRMEQSGTPDALYERPATTFVASFIGTPPMNLIDLDAPDARDLVDPAMADARAGLTLGVRPEHMVIGGEGHAARVVNTEYFGADSVVTCAIGQQAALVRVPGHARFGENETVHISWPREAAHLFETTSGQRVENKVVERV
ncbi:ABC transporter ATP-binding protein [Martelella sp. FLE1502]